MLVKPRHAGSVLHAASQAASDVACSSLVKFALGSGICLRCSAYVALPSVFLSLVSIGAMASSLRFPVPQNHLVTLGPGGSDRGRLTIVLLAPLMTFSTRTVTVPVNANGESLATKQEPSIVHAQSWSANVDALST
jgi:hypothetical protein